MLFTAPHHSVAVLGYINHPTFLVLVSAWIVWFKLQLGEILHNTAKQNFHGNLIASPGDIYKPVGRTAVLYT